MEKRITLPLTEEMARSLRAGDRVLLTGPVYTSRDAGHKRMVEALDRGEALPNWPVLSIVSGIFLGDDLSILCEMIIYAR